MTSNNGASERSQSWLAMSVANGVVTTTARPSTSGAPIAEGGAIPPLAVAIVGLAVAIKRSPSRPVDGAAISKSVDSKSPRVLSHWSEVERHASPQTSYFD